LWRGHELPAEKEREMSTIPSNQEQVVEQVRERYGRIATGEVAGCGCGCATAETEIAAEIGYGEAELAAVPAEANLGLGCGAPLGFLALERGETVVDLGSGGGIDVFLAARQIGADGRAIGVDMTPEMLERARATAARHGFANVEFREGRLEALPVADGSVDAVTSNCVFNLVPDKAAVFREVARVLKPGGRMVVSDIVLDRPLPEALAQDLLAWVGCVAGAESREVYFGRLRDAGLDEVEVLRDVDYAESLAKAAPEEAEALLGRLGLSYEDVRGTVRSVTYRARKPAAGAAAEEVPAQAACCAPGCCAG
jgi:SAM-dependent methyltransferase